MIRAAIASRVADISRRVASSIVVGFSIQRQLWRRLRGRRGRTLGIRRIATSNTEKFSKETAFRSCHTIHKPKRCKTVAGFLERKCESCVRFRHDRGCSQLSGPSERGVCSSLFLNSDHSNAFLRWQHV